MVNFIRSIIRELKIQVKDSSEKASRFMKSRASLQSTLPSIKFVMQLSTFNSLMNVFSLKIGIISTTITRVKFYTHIHNLLVIEALFLIGDNSICHHSISKIE